MMNEHDALQLLQNMERELSFGNYTFDDFCLWPVVRIHVFKAIARSNETKLATKVAGKMQKMIYGIQGILQTNSAIKKTRSANKPSAVIISDTIFLRDKVGDKFKDVLFDDFRDALEARFHPIVFEQTIVHPHSKSTLYSKDIYEEAVGLSSLFIKAPGELSAMAHDLNARTRKYLSEKGLEESLQRYDATNIPWQILSWWKRYQVALDMMRKLSPSFALVLSCSFHWFVAAAKKLGIPVAELQHGFLDKNHPGYIWSDYWKESVPKMTLPDYFLAFGNHWRDMLLENSCAWDENHVVSVGSARIDYWQRKLSGESHKKLSHNSVLVTTQWSVSKEISSFLKQASEIMREEKSSFNLYIKTHPWEKQMVEENYGWVKEYPENVHLVSDFDGLSLYEMLHSCGVHASVYSTCHYEALGFGKPTMVLGIKNWERMKPLIDNKYAVFAETPETFVHISQEMLNINTSGSKHPTGKIEMIQDQFWEPHPREKFREFITSLPVVLE